MNKRLTMLEKLLENGQADSFARYALALEYKKETRFDEALVQFQALREHDPRYIPQYLMTGQLLIELGRTEEARTVLSQGAEAARSAHDHHALGEIESALAAL